MLAEFKMIGAGLATIALSGVGTGIGFIFNGLLDAVAKIQAWLEYCSTMLF